MQTAAQLRLFRKGHILQRSAFCTVQNARRAVDVHAAQHDHSSSSATEDIHQFFRLRTRTEDQVNHYVGSKALQFLSAGVQLVMVAPNLVDAGRYGRCTAMEHSDSLPLPLQCSRNEPSNEAISANEKQTHKSVTRRA